MNGRGTNVQTTGGQANRTNGAASRAERVLVAPAGPDSAPAGEYVPPPEGSRFGPLGTFVKRVLLRLIRFYTHRQDAINDDLGERVRLLETATRRELSAMHREVTDAAVDFGAIADRMRALENVRRIVERSGPYRYEVRVHRRELVELRRQMAVVSARLTVVQRETAPIREANRVLGERVDALDEVAQRLGRDVDRLQASSAAHARTAEQAGARAAALEAIVDERAAEVDRKVDQQAAEIARTVEERTGEIGRTVEERAAEIERTVEERAAEIERTLEERAGEIARIGAQRAAETERVLEERATQLDHNSMQRSTQIERTIEERSAETQRNADRRTSDLERTMEARFETIGSVVAEARATSAAGLSAVEREHHAVAATLRSEIGLLRRSIRDLEPLARPRDLDALRNQLEALALRFADVAATLNTVREAAPAQSETLLAPVRETIAAQRAELEAQRAELEAHRAELNALVETPALAARIGEVAERLAAADRDLSDLRSRLLATPYMSVPMESWPIPRVSTADNFDYVAFEDVFRGPEEFIRERLRVYLPLLDGCTNVVELGCGRGEFLQLMRERKTPATGIDINPDAVARARSKRLKNVVHGDAVAYLAGLGERSVGAVFSAQFAEHLPFEELLRCLELARTRLVPGGIFIAETVNPNSIEGSKTFFVDPSHVKPLFPEVFAFLCRSMGFEGVRLFYPNGAGFDEPSPTSQHEYAVVATAPG